MADNEWVRLTPGTNWNNGVVRGIRWGTGHCTLVSKTYMADRGITILLHRAEALAFANLLPEVAALMDAAQDASALLDLIASDTGVDVNGVADALDSALAALGADAPATVDTGAT